MSTFSENLGNFLTECRDNALNELKAVPVYEKWLAKRTALQDKIIAQVGGELFDEYADASLAINSMEINTALICGATIFTDIGKRFDSSSPESKELAKSLIG